MRGAPAWLRGGSTAQHRSAVPKKAPASTPANRPVNSAAHVLLFFPRPASVRQEIAFPTGQVELSTPEFRATHKAVSAARAATRHSEGAGKRAGHSPVLHDCSASYQSDCPTIA